jgi:hypothetical protein
MHNTLKYTVQETPTLKYSVQATLSYNEKVRLPNSKISYAIAVDPTQFEVLCTGNTVVQY